MNKKAYNLHQIKTAKERKKTFRKETEILFSASDRYNDAYRCVITARMIRERYLVSLILTHEPVQSIVFTNFWIFKTKSTCESKFEKIVEITEGIRDLVETEGMKNVVAQYMLRHSLSAISADVANIYEEAIPYIRNVIDKSTRGNLIKNIPTIPFRTQSGPDKLDDVYKSVANAQNPIPQDDITSPWLSQYDRKKKKLNDVLPGPMSEFQRLSGLIPDRTKQASSSIRMTKTGSTEQEKDAVRTGRDRALKHLQNLAKLSKEDAEQFYESVKEMCLSPKICIQLPKEETVALLTDAIDLTSRTYNRHDQNIAQYLGLSMPPIRAIVSNRPSTTRDTYTIVVDQDRDVVLFNGNLDTVTDPSLDFDSNPILRMYSIEDAADCKASSIIQALSVRDISSGLGSILERIAQKDDLGTCEAIFVHGIDHKNTAEVLADGEESALGLRRILDKIGQILPVSVVKNPEDAIIQKDSYLPSRPTPVHEHFKIRDRVTTKPRLNNPSLGTITNTSNGTVSVQWDSGQHHIYDIAEALMRLAPIVEEAHPYKIDGAVSYELSGMDDKSAMLLASLGVDPVDIYSIASYAKPSSPNALGWEEILAKAMSGIGIEIYPVAGFVRSSGKEAFCNHCWLEGRLPEGNRLVVDVSPNGIKIRAGSTPEYILPSKYSNIVFE
jgi:hypothetical protein